MGPMLFSAVMGAILGFFLLREWPLSGARAIGSRLGVNLPGERVLHDLGGLRRASAGQVSSQPGARSAGFRE